MKIILKKKRDDSLRRHHPWLFSGAIERIEGQPQPGETIDIHAADGAWLARGAWSPESQIRARIWTFAPDETIDEAFLQKRLRAAMAMREQLSKRTSAYRLVNSESDGLPGLIIDRYNDFAVCQFTSCGVDLWREAIVRQLISLASFSGVYERSDGKSREKEGLALRSGTLTGVEPPDLVAVREGDLQLYVDIRNGHKTGFYLDQRDNRAALMPFCGDAEVLNCFSYTGGFGIAALHGGAKSVINIDTSQSALDLAVRNAALNGFAEASMDNIAGDVFKVLRQMREQKRQFDVIILDPPKFAEAAAQVKGAARGYKDINMLAVQLLRPGGRLFTFSCSGHVSQPLFQKIVADAALDAGRDVQIIKHLSQAEDHPISTAFPEGWYLKGLICRVR